MAFRTKKISQMDPKGSNLASTDLLEISQLVSGSYVTKSITGAEIISGATTGFVPTTRTLTINGTTQDLSADRTFTISTGITIGTTAITSGTVGRVLFEGTGNVVQESANLFWDNTNGRLGIGGTPVCKVQIITNNFTTTPPWSYDNTISQLAGATNQGLLATYSSTLGSFIGSVFPANAWLNLTYVANNHIFSVAGTEAMRIASPTRNVLINTTTDAGFRLDVNGTARVSVATGTLTNQFTIISSSSRLDISPYDSSTYGVILRPSLNNGGAFVPISLWGSRIQLEGSVHISANATGGNASAQLDVTSTTKGFLPPRMTTTQKNAIATPATGLVIFDSTLNKLCVRGASAWETITSV